MKLVTADDGRPSGLEAGGHGTPVRQKVNR